MMHISRLSWCRRHGCYLLARAHAVRGKMSPSSINCGIYVPLISRRMFHGQFVNLDGCRLVTVADEKEISRRLCEIQTTGEIMNFVSTVDSESWTPELSSLVTERLVSTHYQSLCTVYPWLQESITAASRQLWLTDTVVLQNATAPVHLHSAYNTWMNIVEQNCASYNTDQLANALLSATNLFVDPCSSFMHRLLSEMHQRLPDFNLTALTALSSSLKILPGNSDVLLRALMKRMQTLLATMESVNATELVLITTILSNSKRYINADLLCQLVSWLLKMIESNKEVLLSPECIEGFVRLGYIQAFSHEHNSQRLVDIGVETCQKYINELTVSELAKMCILLQSRVKQDKSLRHVYDKVESRAIDLLSRDSRLCEVIDLMNCLTKYSSEQVILQFYSALHSQLICNDYIDVYSLSSIARTLVRMESVNTDLLMLVQRLVVEQASNIVPHRQLFRWIEKFLGRHSFLDKDLERLFNDRILSYIRSYVGVSTKYASSVVSAYLVPLINDGLPTPVFKQLIGSATHWHKNTLVKHTLLLNSVQGSLSSNRQLKQLNCVLYQTLCRQLDLVDSLESLHSVACSLLMHSCQQHPVVTDRVMNMYTQYSSHLSDNISACKISAIFTKLSYHLPSVYDDLVHYVVSTNNSNTELLV